MFELINGRMRVVQTGDLVKPHSFVFLGHVRSEAFEVVGDVGDDVEL